MDSPRQSSFIIRDARPEDAPRLAELGTLIFRITYGHAVEPGQLQAYFNEFYSVDAFGADITDPSKDMVVASGSEIGNVVGFALLTAGTSDPCLEHVRNAIELQRIYCHPDIHGRGVGKLLADRVEGLARGRGFDHMWVGVWEENAKAIKIYEKWGYKRIGEHNFKLGEVIHLDHIMLKQL